MFKEFTCRKCDAEQEQEIVGAFGANLEYGGLGFTTCWSCGDQEWYIFESTVSYQTPEQRKFWENWIESRDLWKEMEEKEREKYKKEIYSNEEQMFKNFHTQRICKSTTSS